MFDTYELSARRGKPVHLFIFTRQSKTWRLASAARDMTIGGHTYTAAPISRSEIKETVEAPQDSVTIEFPYQRDPDAVETPVTQDLGSNWFPYAPSDPISVICMSTHLGDPDAEIIVEWMGRVAQPEFTDGKLSLICQPSGNKDKTLRRGPKWQRACWKSTYSTGLRGCNLIAGPITADGTITAVNGSDITADAFSAQPLAWVGGIATWADDSDVAHTANITAWSGTTTLTLDDVTGIDVDTVVTAYTSSLHTITTLTAVDGLTLTSADFADAPFDLTGGALSWTRSDGLVESRPIMSHKGSDIIILYGGVDLAVDLFVDALPDCPRTWDACDARGNTIHYGGAIYEPTENPYAGASMSWS